MKRLMRLIKTVCEVAAALLQPESKAKHPLRPLPDKENDR